MRARRLAVSLLLAALLPGCAPDVGQQPPPEPPPAPAVMARYRLVDPPPPPRHAESTRDTQEARRTDCAGDDQPAIVSINTSEHRVGPPVWSCFAGCGPGLEYVTRFDKRHGDWQLRAACAPVCPPGEHRISYAQVADAQTCEPGTLPPSEQAALARERDEQRASFVAERRSDLAAVEAQLRTLETAPLPWAHETFVAWKEVAGAMAGFPSGNESWDDRDLSRATREKFIARTNPELATRLSALRSRVARVKGIAAEAERREAFVDAHQECESQCGQAVSSCTARCSEVSAAACGECGRARTVCLQRCLR